MTVASSIMSPDGAARCAGLAVREGGVTEIL